MSLFILCLVGAPTTPLHCSCYDIIYSCLPCYYFWACRLKRLPCQFLILFRILVFITQHSCWVSSFNILGFLIHFILWASSARFILWASLAQLLHPLPLGLSAFPFTNSFLWAPLAPFCFLSISYDSHEFTTSFFGASLARLLSLGPLYYFVGLWTIIFVIFAQWSLFCCFLFPHFFILLGFFYLWPLLSKMGINSLKL